MSVPDCDQEYLGVVEFVRGMSDDQVRELTQEARASDLCRLLGDASRGGGLAEPVRNFVFGA